MKHTEIVAFLAGMFIGVAIIEAVHQDREPTIIDTRACPARIVGAERFGSPSVNVEDRRPVVVTAPGKVDFRQ